MQLLTKLNCKSEETFTVGPVLAVYQAVWTHNFIHICLYFPESHQTWEAKPWYSVGGQNLPSMAEYSADAAEETTSGI